MNQQLTNKWTEFKGEIRRLWGKFIDDETDTDVEKVNRTTERVEDSMKESRDDVSPKGRSANWTDLEPH